MYNQQYYLNNKKRWEEYNKKANPKRKEYWKKYSRKWKEDNPEKHKLYAKYYRIEYKDQIKTKKYLKLLELGKHYVLSSSRFFHALEGWKHLIRNRDKFTCQVCGEKAKLSHHIIHKSDYPSLALNMNNGITLCTKHHYEVHGWKEFVT